MPFKFSQGPFSIKQLKILLSYDDKLKIITLDYLVNNNIFISNRLKLILHAIIIFDLFFVQIFLIIFLDTDLKFSMVHLQINVSYAYRCKSV